MKTLILKWDVTGLSKEDIQSFISGAKTQTKKFNVFDKDGEVVSTSYVPFISEEVILNGICDVCGDIYCAGCDE
jgi:hypothetical protein